jgi:hypothetical protein
MIFLEGVYEDRSIQGLKPRFRPQELPRDEAIAAVLQTSRLGSTFVFRIDLATAGAFVSNLLSFVLSLTLVVLGGVTRPASQPAMSELHVSIWSPAQRRTDCQ